MYEYKKGLAISVKVPEEMYDAITRACQITGQKRSEFVRAAFDAELRRVQTATENTYGELAVERAPLTIRVAGGRK